MLIPSSYLISFILKPSSTGLLKDIALAEVKAIERTRPRAKSFNSRILIYRIRVNRCGVASYTPHMNVYHEPITPSRDNIILLYVTIFVKQYYNLICIRYKSDLKLGNYSYLPLPLLLPWFAA